MNSEIRKVILKKNKDEPVMRRHPWIFSGAIERKIGNIRLGDFVHVESISGKFLGAGFYQDSSIAVKLLSFHDDDKSLSIEQLLELRIKQALDYRTRMGLFNNQNTNCFRLINAEGDQIPGLIVDKYADTYVIQCHTIGILQFEQTIASIISKLTGSKSIISKSKDTADSGQNKILIGNHVESIIATENNLKFLVDPINGQKTGFFLDQRNNRDFIKSICKDKTVLNLCCYTGGFSIAALADGAKKVVSVDSSKHAIDFLEQNIKINNFNPNNHESILDDVFEYLQKSTTKFDLVICDPPAFAKHKSARTAAIKGYRRLNNLALKSVKPTGQLATFSCSGVIDEQSFDSAVLSSFIDQQRTARVTRRFWQAECHSVSIFHPESRYLKGLFIECD